MLDAYLFSKHLEEDETVQMIVHKHWSVGTKALVVPSLVLMLSLAFLGLSTTRGGLLVGGACSLLSLLWWARNFFDYYLDAWIVTDHGIIDLEWKGWFHRQAARVLYSDIQGVSYEIQGLQATFLRFGTISVEKISTGATISLPHVFQPRTVEACILRNMESYLHKKNLKNSKHVQEILAGFIAGHMQSDGMSKKSKVSHDEPQEEEKPAPRKRQTFRSSKIGSRRAP
jgi:hypothetical protein